MEIKKKPNRKRNLTIHLQLTAEEKDLIIELAQKEHLTKTDAVLKAVEHYLKNIVA